MLIRFTVPGATLAFARTLACFSRFDALLLARLEIERVTLDVLDNLLLQDFTLKAFEGALQAFAVL